MSKIANSIGINEMDDKIMSGGYNIADLLNSNNHSMEGGGEPSIFTDMQIPLGLYCDETKPVSDFYKVVKSSTIDDDLFDKLFDMVSKTKSKATRKEPVKTHNVTKKIREQ
jgi:hypothetical protein